MLLVSSRRGKGGGVLLPHWCCIRSAAGKAGCKPHGRQASSAFGSMRVGVGGCGLFLRISKNYCGYEDARIRLRRRRKAKRSERSSDTRKVKGKERKDSQCKTGQNEAEDAKSSVVPIRSRGHKQQIFKEKKKMRKEEGKARAFPCFVSFRLGLEMNFGDQP